MHQAASRRLLARSADLFFSRRYCASPAAGALESKSLDENGSKLELEPSKVLHFRNLTPYIRRGELEKLVRPFGSVTSYRLTTRTQALLEMKNVKQAKKVVDHFSSAKALVKKTEVYVGFSRFQELEKDVSRLADPKQGASSKVLAVTVTNPIYPIDVYVLHRVFCPHGSVEKITISRKLGICGYIQFDSVKTAAHVKDLLNDRHIFDGCCKMEIQYAKSQELGVYFNDDNNRDFKDTSIPSRVRSDPSILGAPPVESVPALTAEDAAAGAPAVVPTPFIGRRKRVVRVSNLNVEKVDEDKLFNLFSPYGKIRKVQVIKVTGQGLIEMSDAFQAELASACLKGARVFEKELDTVVVDKELNLNQSRDYTDAHDNIFFPSFVRNCRGPSPTIYVWGLPSGVTDAELITHFSPHGEIAATEVFASEEGKPRARVRFDTKEQATEAVACKQYSVVNGSTIRLAFAINGKPKKTSSSNAAEAGD
ncbi:polypyrimidine tract-binding protein homolog 3 isoform X1 [Selaginella moellendorffii]|uniref:polypyrimidine tract-binding protein homolog 3 isoform X1 n=1 Tax=Selaginella moellendorffii TaxID=88036 RepID=UPI000D1CBE2C|nr:polypyrimidine tract-binding protein homolog 3 isoform X1 [Selaginella moellendorffii]|eukprot:XP_024521608.1 polypyrimidine tract-binding protein homolog 3 isoform X1 [Selaginella moellendorffii]